MSRRTLTRQINTAMPAEKVLKKYLTVIRHRELHTMPEFLPKISSSSLFHNVQPLELEIGCGTGEFLCKLASLNPQSNYIGIDISFRPLYKAVNTANELLIDNTHFFRADFKRLTPLLVPNSVSTVYLHFPDPHMKSRHRKRRILSYDFLTTMHETLVKSGVLSVLTDHKEYFFEMLELVESDNRFEKVHSDRYLFSVQSDIKSRFQMIWESHGLNTLGFQVKKI